LRVSKNEIAVLQAYQAKVNDFEKSIRRYETEKEEIKKEAEKFEQVRDEAQLHSKAFGMAVIFLQISILLSSIAALIKRKYLWYMAMGVGTVGLFYFINGFLLFL